MHYIKVDEKTWYNQIEKRNFFVKEGMSEAYYVDENLLKKSTELFEEPGDDEGFIIIDKNWCLCM